MAKRNIIRRIISSPLIQTFLIYLSGGWIALEMTDYFIRKYDLNESISDVLSIFLLIGLPVAIFLTWYLSREKVDDIEIAPDSTSDKKSYGWFNYMKKKTWFSIPVSVVLLLIILAGIRFTHRQIKIKWAREEAIPQMQNWVHDWDHVNAFHLRQQVKKYIPDDPEFIRMDSLITKRFTIITDPEGADVYYKVYPDVEGEWIFLGTSPLQNIEMPNWTMFRWKLEKPECEVVYAVASTFMDTLYRTMHDIGKIPDRMVYVEGINMETASDFLSEEKHGFFIDRNEVTNKQFKEFINQGGYQDPDFWQNEFILNNEILAFEEAMDHFIDATGRSGPSTWEVGDYPDGQANYPVNGISWHEAAAYAVYAGKSLPTNDHWRSAAGLEIPSYLYGMGSVLIPMSNMKGIGPEPVGSNPSVNCFGTNDMAGNVREWCWNESSLGRIIYGGAWDDVSYLATGNSQVPPFDRSIKNGFRCVIYLNMEKIPKQVFQPVEIESQRDYRSEVPASAVETQIYKKQFLYDKKDLNSRIEDKDVSPEDWIIEKVSYDAAYEKERMLAYLFLPKGSIPPYQTIIYFPGGNSLIQNSIFECPETSRNLYYILKSGRAVLFPIYKGTFDRKGGYCSPPPERYSHQFSECMVKWVKDLSRSIDYLETRSDIDISKLGYLGDSWGGYMGAVIPAVEDRIKLNVLLRAGLPTNNRYPEVDPINFVTQVEIPILMINGKYDFIFPFESSVVPMFNLFGTPRKDKKMVSCNTDHFIPKTEMIKETLNWLDKYFGPVQR